MNFKVLSVTALLLSTVCFSVVSSAEKMPESSEQKELRIEGELNTLFRDAMKTAAIHLGKSDQVEPFGMMTKVDGTIAIFKISDNDKSRGLSVAQKTHSIRKLLSELALTKQITSSVLTMFATLTKEGQATTQEGLTFEMEHKEGISIVRFLPVSRRVDSENSENNKLVFEIESISTVNKPKTIFVSILD